MAAPRKWFLNPMIAEGFGDSQGTLANANPMPPPADTAGFPPGAPIDTLGNEGTGFTGAGAPSQTAGQVEKGEWVFSAPATQALGPDTLQAMKQKVDSGQLNAQTVNTIRQAVGLAPLRSFQDGTDLTDKQNLMAGNVTNKQLTMQNQPAPLSDKQNLMAGNVTNKQLIMQDQGVNALRDSKLSALGASNAGTLAGPTAYAGPSGSQYQGLNPAAAIKKNAVNASNIGAGAQYGSGFQYQGQTPQGAIDLAKRQATPGYRPGTTSDFYRNIGMGGLASIAAGKSPYFETLQEMQQRRLSGQGAAQEAALRQELAQGGVGGGVARSAMGEQTRDISGQMAEARATTTAEQMKLAEQATGELASQGLQGMQNEEQLRQNDIDQQNWQKEFELTKTTTERNADNAEYTNLKDQYDQAIEDGRIPEAQAMWADLRSRFPNLMSSVEPNWATIQTTFDRKTLSDLKTLVGNSIADGSSFASVSGLITDMLENSSGMSIADLAAREGTDVDSLLRGEYDRIRDSGDDVKRLVDFYVNASSGVVDTPAERSAVSDWVSNMITTQGLKMGEDGNITSDADSITLPWNAPKTAHLFDAEAQANPGLMAARTAYVGSATTPIDYNTWKTAYSAAMDLTLTDGWQTTKIDGKTYDNPAEFITAYIENAGKVDKQEDAPRTITVMGANGQSEVLSVTESSDGLKPPGATTGYVADGKPVYWDDTQGKYIEYTYENAKHDYPNDANVIRQYAQADDPTAVAEARGMIANGDFSALSGLSPTDTTYKSLTSGIPTYDTINDAGRDGFAVGKVYKLADGSVVKVTSPRTQVVDPITPAQQAFIDNPPFGFTKESARALVIAKNTHDTYTVGFTKSDGTTFDTSWYWVGDTLKERK